MNYDKILPMLSAIGLAVGMAGCAGSPEKPQPAFYRDLAAPGAHLDPGSATAIINDYRRSLGLAPLTWDATLAARAEVEATALAREDRLLEGGKTVETGAAEGILRSVSGGYHTFADAFSGWRGSRSHDALLRDSRGGAFAIAAVARPGSRHRVYWVMLVRALQV
jgi:uncharacterized protein YkwD